MLGECEARRTIQGSGKYRMRKRAGISNQGEILAVCYLNLLPFMMTLASVRSTNRRLSRRASSLGTVASKLVKSYCRGEAIVPYQRHGSDRFVEESLLLSGLTLSEAYQLSRKTSSDCRFRVPPVIEVDKVLALCKVALRQYLQLVIDGSKVRRIRL
jgi:hypothetical protein